MGLDAWVFSRTKENYQKWRSLLEKLVVLQKDVDGKIGKSALEYQSKYPDFKDENITVNFVNKHFSGKDKDKEEIKGFIKETLDGGELFETRMDLNDLDKDEYELNYWRKNYPVHNYIVKHFLGDGKSDNCEPTVLTKDGVKEMVAVFKKELAAWKKDGDARQVEWFKPSECDYVSLDALAETVYFFECLVGDFSDNTVFYYCAWY